MVVVQAYRWFVAPFGLLCLSFCLGVRAACCSFALIGLVWLFAFGILVICIGIWRRIYWAYWILPFCFFIAGTLCYTLQSYLLEQRMQGSSLPQQSSELVVQGTISSAPQVGQDRISFLLNVFYISKQTIPNNFTKSRGLVKVFSEKEICGTPGDIIRIRLKLTKPQDVRFPGDSSRSLYLAREGIVRLGYVSDPSACINLGQQNAISLKIWIALIRDQLRQQINKHLSSLQASLVRALTTGDKAGLSDDTRAAIRQAGLSHLLAVSGFHIGVLAIFWMSILRFVFVRIRWIAEGFGALRCVAIGTFPVIVIYPILVGLSPSSSRAGLIFAIILSAQLFLRKVDIWNSFWLVLLILGVLDPSSLSSAGLQLSFAAVASLIRIPKTIEYWTGFNPHRWPYWMRWLWSAMVSSLAATIGTSAFVAYYFQEISLISIISNIPAALVASLAIPFSIIGSVFCLFFEPIGKYFLYVSGYLAELLNMIAISSSKYTWALMKLRGPTEAEVWLYVVALWLLTEVSDVKFYKNRKFYVGILVLGVALALPRYNNWVRSLSKELQVAFLPVGQGDAAVIEFPGGKVAVVDVGPAYRYKDAGSKVIYPYLRHRGIDHIDIFVVSHTHADHIGGLLGLIDSVPIQEVWYSGDMREGPAEQLDKLQSLNIVKVVAPQSENIGSVLVQVLAPVGPYESYASVNDASVVLKLSYGQFSILFTGDIEADGESKLIQSFRQLLNVDVLKAAHHGSRSSSTERFLEATSPKHIIVSCGLNNRFGFPHKEALVRINKIPSVDVWRTDRHGAVSIVSDGVDYEVLPYLELED